MNYWTIDETAQRWGITPLQVRNYCAHGCIYGATLERGEWRIPVNAHKKGDLNHIIRDTNEKKGTIVVPTGASRKNRNTKDNVGVVYLFTNSCYEKENTYKYGITINPFERKRIQKNSTPPTHPFYDRIVMFSPDYKKIEQWLENRFKKEGYLLDGDGGKEWVKANFDDLLSIYMESLLFFPKTEMCFGGKRYRAKSGTIEECKLPNCRLDLLGILDGKEIKCTKNGESFRVRDNKIVVDGSDITLTSYMNQYYKRSGNTNEHNGYQYFTYKGVLIYDMWQSLVGAK